MVVDLLILAGFAQAGTVFSGAPATSQPMQVALVAETLSPRPGNQALVGLKMTPKPGWHGYWSNAGDSGLPPTVHWSAPSGVHLGALRHPAPTLLRVMGLTSYVNSGPHVLTATMTIDRTVVRGTPLPLTVEVSFAVCSERLCVPQHATLTLPMVAGGGKASADATLLRRARAAEPRPTAPGQFAVQNGRLTLELPTGARLDAATTHFFPDDNGWFEPEAARALPGTRLRIVDPIAAAPPAIVTGVVSDGRTALRLSFHRGALATAAHVVPIGGDNSSEKPLASRTKPSAAPADQHPPRAWKTTATSTRTGTAWPVWLGAALIAAIGFGVLLVAVTRRRLSARL